MGIITALISAIFIISPPNFQNSPGNHGKVAHFNFPNIAGGVMTNEDFKGKVTVVDVWATWCRPCIEEIPMYNRLYNAFDSEDVAIVGITVESPRRDISSKVRQLGIKYPILVGDERAIKTFGAQVFPTTVVLNKDGTIYKVYRGKVSNIEQKLKRDIENLLAE